MTQTYALDGITFQYPDDWNLEHEETSAGWTITLQSPATSFLMLSLREDSPDPEELARQTLDDLRGELADPEVLAHRGTIAGQPTVGHELAFFSLDFASTIWTDCVELAQGTLLVLRQGEDDELTETFPLMQAICDSIQIDEDAGQTT